MRKLGLVGFVLAGILAFLVLSSWRTRKAGDSEALVKSAPSVQSPLAVRVFRAKAKTTVDASAGVAGRVVGTGGQAIGDATVCASCSNCQAADVIAPACTQSASDGRYAIDLASGGYYVGAVAAGFLPGSALEGKPVFVGDGERRRDVDVTMTPGGSRVTGHVVDATGGAIANARVRALRLWPPRLSVEVITDASGAFSLSLTPGTAQLIVRADGYAPASAHIHAPHDNVSVALVPAGSVQGVVVSVESGEPVAGVEVRALPAQMPGVSVFPSAVSGLDGKFEVQQLEPGGYLLVAKGDHWREVRPQQIELGLAAHVEGVRIEVQGGTPVGGRVLEEGATPCLKGYVTLEPLVAPGGGDLAQQDQQPHSSLIQADGSAYFPGVSSGAYAVDVQCVGHYLVEGPQSIHVGAEPMDNLVWHVTAGIGLEVTVVNGAGQPVPNAPFDLGFLGPDGTTFEKLAVGMDGRLDLAPRAPGKYSLTPRGGPTVTVELLTNRKKESVELKVDGTGEIELHVVDASGAPIDGAIPTVHQFKRPGERAEPIAVSGRPLGEGRIALGPVKAGRYSIRVVDGSNPPVEVGAEGPPIVVTDGQTTKVEARLSRGGTIEGEVVDEDGGPMPNVWVMAKSESERSRTEEILLMTTPPRRILTDLDGRFVLPGLAEDAGYTLRAEEPAGAVAQRAGVRCGESVTLELQRSASISGVVIGYDGRSLPQYGLQAVHRATGAVREVAVNDTTGAFALSGITPGTIDIVVGTSDGLHSETEVQVSPGANLEGLRIEPVPHAVTTGTDPSIRPPSKLVEETGVR